MTNSFIRNVVASAFLLCACLPANALTYTSGGSTFQCGSVCNYFGGTELAFTFNAPASPGVVAAGDISNASFELWTSSGEVIIFDGSIGGSSAYNGRASSSTLVMNAQNELVGGEVSIWGVSTGSAAGIIQARADIDLNDWTMTIYLGSNGETLLASSGVGPAMLDGYIYGAPEVPLPASAWLMGSALLGLVVSGRDRLSTKDKTVGLAR